MTTFVTIGGIVMNVDNIAKVEFSDIEDLHIVVYPKGGLPISVIGLQAIELMMAIKPSALESWRMRWKKRAWMVHNLLGHPLMQIAALLGQYELAMWLHDVTAPRPLGKYMKKTEKHQTRR